MVAYIAVMVTVTVIVIVRLIAVIETAMVFPIARTAARTILAATNSKRQPERGWRIFCAEVISMNRPYPMLVPISFDQTAGPL